MQFSISNPNLKAQSIRVLLSASKIPATLHFADPCRVDVALDDANLF